MRQLSKYALYDKVTGDLVFSGSAPECLEFCNGKPSAFCTAAQDPEHKTYRGYRVVQIERSPERTSPDKRLIAAAKRWDSFITPIRERYGVPVYGAKGV